MTSVILSVQPAPVHALKYASGKTAQSGRQTLIRSALILAIVVVTAGVLHAAAWMFEKPNRFVPDEIRYSIRRYVPDNFGVFMAVVAAGGLLVCGGHWLQARPVRNWKFFSVLVLINVIGLSLGFAYPERPHLNRYWQVLSAGM